MKFEQYKIDARIKRSLSESGFMRPTDIQYKSIPPILQGEDLLAIAQTGTGKTAAFVIPTLDALCPMLDDEKFQDEIKCLVMVPTRELAEQITAVFQDIGKYLPLRTVCITGGLKQDPQIHSLAKRTDILVATPGRMFDLIYQKYIKITKVQILILDEADKMLELGFLKDIQDVKKFLPKMHQTLFFSATINEEIKELAYQLVKNAIRIQLSPKDPVSKNVTHSVAFINMDDKRYFLERLVKENPETKILAFVRTQVRAERVMAAMERVGIKSLTIHGGKDQTERTKSLQAFKNGDVFLLITTDVSARGIDIPGVQYVVNYDMPDIEENYVHRVGRTGRGVQKGRAVSFCSLDEKIHLDAIEKYIGKEIDVLEIKNDSYGQTLDFTEEKSNDWKKLIQEAEKNETDFKKPKKKKK